MLRNLVKSILLVQIPFIKRCSCLLVIQSLSVSECRTDLVSNLVSLLFFAVFLLLYFLFSFKFKFVFINIYICYLP